MLLSVLVCPMPALCADSQEHLLTCFSRSLAAVLGMKRTVADGQTRSSTSKAIQITWSTWGEL
jgi:hypothetical protein